VKNESAYTVKKIRNHALWRRGRERRKTKTEVTRITEVPKREGNQNGGARKREKTES
jgi:hypothetical protein